MEPVTTQPIPSLRLDEESHTYWYNDRRIPGISELLRYWGFLDDTYYNEESREVGRGVHAIIHDYELGGAAGHEFKDPKVLKRFDEYLRFRDDKDFRVIAVEKIFADPAGRYACKIDLLGHFGEQSMLSLIEIKCGVELPWHRLQTAGQRRCVKMPTWDIVAPMRRFALYLSDKRPYNLKEHVDRSEEGLIDGYASGYWWNRNNDVRLNGGTNGKH